MAAFVIDRRARSRVPQAVSRRPSRFLPAIVCGLGLCALVAACGGKGKGDKTTPDKDKAGKGGETALMEDGDPVGDGAGSGAKPEAGGGGDTASAPGAASEAGEAAPAIEPPDLDIGASEQAQRLREHLTQARNALRGPTRDPDLALKECKLALLVDATNIDAIALMAHAYYHKRLYDTAEVVLDMTFRNRKKAKSSPRIYYVYGLVYDSTDRPEQARLAYENALKIAPNYRSALINVGAHYLRNKSYRQAIEVFEKLTGKLDVTTATAWTNLGSAYRGHSMDYPAGSGQRDAFLAKAELAYRRALQADRNYASVYYNLGLLFLDADPFPGPGGPMDKLKRLERSKTYFDEYRNMAGADIDLVERRLKQVKKLISREQKRRKRPKDD